MTLKRSNEPSLDIVGVEDNNAASKGRDRHRPRGLRSDLPDEPLARIFALLQRAKREKARPEIVEQRLRELAARIATDSFTWTLAERGTLLVLADLAGQAWTFETARDTIWMTPPSGDARDGEAPSTTKGRLRAPLEAARQRQLAETSVRKFLTSMESERKRGGDTIKSIHSVIDDGADLARVLANVATHDEVGRAAALAELVRPVIQLVTDERCEHSGLLLRDIWRYFRHTWSLEYRPTPGRNAQFLVRNAARPNCPIMGIAALTNPVLQLEDRDDWIGWSFSAAVKRLSNEPDAWLTIRTGLLRTLEAARGETRVDDLLDPQHPVVGLELEQQLAALGHAAGREREAALRLDADEAATRPSSSKILPRDEGGDVDWAKAGSDPLFRSKRARALSEIMNAIRWLDQSPTNGVDFLAEMRGTAELDKAFRTALREVRKRGLASRILEVNVCGAVTPYRDLLGGKLVALSLTTQEVHDAYRDKYRSAPSEIASKMAGRPIIRENDVCLLTTTSLYGVGSSQYNRLKVSADGFAIQWHEIGATRGFGTIHFREETIQVLRELSIAKRGHRHVNNVFGEGTSPLLRQVRDGLSALKFDANDVLEHSATRIIYATELYPGARGDLTSNEVRQVPMPSMEAVGAAWRERWLARRIERDDVLERVSQQGASDVVSSLAAADTQQPDLFVV